MVLTVETVVTASAAAATAAEAATKIALENLIVRMCSSFVRCCNVNLFKPGISVEQPLCQPELHGQHR